MEKYALDDVLTPFTFRNHKMMIFNQGGLDILDRMAHNVSTIVIPCISLFMCVCTYNHICIYNIYIYMSVYCILGAPLSSTMQVCWICAVQPCLSELHQAFPSFPGSGWPHSAALHQAIHGTWSTAGGRSGGPKITHVSNVKKKSKKTASQIESDRNEIW